MRQSNIVAILQSKQCSYYAIELYNCYTINNIIIIQKNHKIVI